MFKKLWNFNALYLVLLCFGGLQTICLFFVSKPLFLASLILLCILAVVTVVRMITTGRRFDDLINSMNEDLNNAASNALTSFVLPILIVSETDEIVWYNSRFAEQVNTDSDGLIGQNINQLLGENGSRDMREKRHATITYGNRIYDVYESVHMLDGEIEQKIYCFIDLTDLRRTASEYQLSRLLVAFIAIDNLDDLTRNMRDSERNTVSSRIQKVLEDWFATTNGFSRKLSGERYIFIFEERDLISFTAAKFEILGRIRSIDFGERGHATVSIGIGHGKNLRECEEQAAQALDMALGRGGDQVAIKKLDHSFQFFGGISGANEKRTRVRTRIVASALLELIQSSEQVVLMGHKFADLDCFGSAYALCSAIRKHTETPAYIAIRQKNALVHPLFDRIRTLGGDLMITEPEQLLERVNKQTLLIIVDTHRSMMLECPELLDLAGTVVVIDHHRKSVDHIANAVIFYHESAASSASEMVSELLQYISESAVGRAEAEAMLSGIMLDTRNYCMHTGVRTFEASAFLRRRGADPVAVKKLFADSMEHYKMKNAIIATAEQHNAYAIAMHESDISPEEIRIISSEAADELLNIAGVKASFVISRLPDHINISARSFGEINVQLIMERLGGGGHRTMAACQLLEQDMNEVKNLLIDAIHQQEEDK